MQKGYNIQVKGFWISDFLFPLYLNQHFLDETKRTLLKKEFEMFAEVYGEKGRTIQNTLLINSKFILGRQEPDRSL